MDDTPAQVAWWQYQSLKDNGADAATVDKALSDYLREVEQEMARKKGSNAKQDIA